uniref:Zinc finger and BTB domain-containing protein 49-like n=1 Tax=Phallusia mammillata TaxID=59560 RepID=A0A6F9DXV1_9ASCI|nr:zinc finger and BTB domain-containing protein 49-like [Phallusia mammillata]
MKESCIPFHIMAYFVCSLCGGKLPNAERLEKHKKSCAKLIVCECGKRFTRSCNLKRHRENSCKLLNISIKAKTCNNQAKTNNVEVPVSSSESTSLTSEAAFSETLGFSASFSFKKEISESPAVASDTSKPENTFSTKATLRRHIRTACQKSPLEAPVARCPSCGITCMERNFSRHLSSCSRVWGHCRSFDATKDCKNPDSDNRKNTDEAEKENTATTTTKNLFNCSESRKPLQTQNRSSTNATKQTPIQQWLKKGNSHINQYHSEVSMDVDGTDSSTSLNNDLKDDGDSKEKLAPLLRRFEMGVKNAHKPPTTEKTQTKPQCVKQSSKEARLPSSESNPTKPKSEYQETRLQGYQVLEALTNQLTSLQQNAIMVFR